ncbi:MAG: restriction endonuclease subunit S [Paludibacter sp.]
MKKGWEIKRLKDAALVIAGQSPEGKFYNDQGNGIPFYQGKKEFTDKFIGEATIWTTKVTKIAEPLDILISVRAPVGALNISTEKICIGRGLAAIRPLNTLDRNFAYYFLLEQQDKIVGKEGAVFPSLNKAQIEDIEIPLPPLSVQQRIVSLLDESFEKVDTLKTNAERNLQNAKELFESALTDELKPRKGWEEKKLGELATFRNGMNFTRTGKGDVIQIVGVKDFQKSFWVPFDTLESVTLDGKLNEIDLLKENDILVVRSNGNPALIGRTLLSGKVNGNISHSGFTIRIRLDSSVISPIYLCHYLKTKKTRKELVDSGNGVGIKSLNQGSLSSLSIPFPKSLIEQQTIVQKLEVLSTNCQSLETNYQKTIVQCEDMKKAILAKAFNGEL